MDEKETEALWDKHNLLDEAVKDLFVAKELAKLRLDQHDSQFNKISSEFGEKIGQQGAKLDSIIGGQATLTADLHKRQGASEANSRQLWLAFSLIGLLFTALNLYMGSR